MIGDSVTDCGRSRPVGEGFFGGLGDGYVREVAGLLALKFPDHRIRVVNMGVGGDTVRHLRARWETDVMDQKPNWLSVMIGINDVWRQFDYSLQPEFGVMPQEYEETLNSLIVQTKGELDGLVLMTPFHIEDNPADTMRARMDEYGGIVKRLADKHGAIFVDTQAAFSDAMKFYHSASLSGDRIHPNVVGHLVLARAFLSSIGFEI
jgi:lysophospholipase L1-like esterase